MALTLETLSPPSSITSSVVWDDVGSVSDCDHFSLDASDASEFLFVEHDNGSSHSMDTSTCSPRTSVATLPSGISDGPSSEPTRQRQLLGFKDGNIRLRVGTHDFLVHMYKLQEFSVLAARLQTALGPHKEQCLKPATAKALGIVLEGDPEDFANLFQVLYTPAYAEPTKGYPTSILKSTLRLATRLQHPTLRSYAIDRLQRQHLTSIERIAIARECNIPSWIEDALENLCRRERSITLKEAQILGIPTFVEVASRREAYRPQAEEVFIPIPDRPIRYFDEHYSSGYTTPFKLLDDPPCDYVGDGCSKLDGDELTLSVQAPTETLTNIITTAFSAVGDT